jgi:flavin-dependent dehydrogenase
MSISHAYRTCDVVVVGAGPAGAATALALGRRHLHVLLLDVTTGRSPSLGESLHGVAASSLRELGVWSLFLEQQARPSYLSEIAWESADLRERHAIDHAWGPERHLDRAAFDMWLCGEAIRSGAEHLRCSRVDEVQFDRGCERCRSSIRTTDGTFVIESRAIVDATGRAAAIVRRLGGRITTTPDRLIALSKVYEERLARPSVLIEAVPDGWWYSAPLPNDRSIAIWFTDATTSRGRASRAAQFEAALQSAPQTRARFDGMTSNGDARVCAAGPSLTLYDSSIPALPVGDAATAFDPISGDGLCFALRSALEAADTLAHAFAGHRSALPAYASGVEAVFARHVTRRAALYESVTRFGDAAFWKRLRVIH